MSLTSHPGTVRRAGPVISILHILALTAFMVACGAPQVGQRRLQVDETPTTAGLASSCGDGLCEKDEAGKCCTDCGCSDPAKICDRYTARCIGRVVLSDETKSKLVEKYKPWPLVEEVDEICRTEATRLLKFDCTDKEKCVYLVYVDADGSIVQEQKIR